MKILVDNALSPDVSEGLRQVGHDAVHVRDLGLASADDSVIFARAAQDETPGRLFESGVTPVLPGSIGSRRTTPCNSPQPSTCTNATRKRASGR
jgi:hypothetical protein